jgi:hypothetical protein
MDDQTDMGESCESVTALMSMSAASKAAENDPASGSRFVRERSRPQAAPGKKLLLRCGHCLMPMPDVDSDPTPRCPHCGRRNALPTQVWMSCDQCGFEQPVALAAVKTQALCMSCGRPLEAGDVVLTRLRRRHGVRVRHVHHHSRTHERHDRAILLLLMLTAILTLSLKLFSQL